MSHSLKYDTQPKDKNLALKGHKDFQLCLCSFMNASMYEARNSNSEPPSLVLPRRQLPEAVSFFIKENRWSQCSYLVVEEYSLIVCSAEFKHVCVSGSGLFLANSEGL